MEIKLLHTSDLHIDWLFENFSPSARIIRRKELLKSLDIIADIAIQKQVKALMISGDLFHAPQVDRSSLTAVLTNFHRLKEHGIFVMLLPGNHDPITPNGLYDFTDFPENVHVFREKGWSAFTKIDNLKIFGFPYFEEFKNNRVLAELQVNKNEGFNVAMLHGSYKEMKQIENYMPFSNEDIAQSNVDYIALGHYHNFKDCSRNKVKCFYPGSPNCLSFNNITERQIALVRLSLNGTEVKPVIIPGRRYLQLDYDITMGNPLELFMKLDQLKDPALCLKVVITGLTEQTKLIDVEDIKHLFADKYFYFEVLDKTNVLTDDSHNIYSVKGIFINKMISMLKDPNMSAEEKEIIEKAFKIGYTALERGRL